MASQLFNLCRSYVTGDIYPDEEYRGRPGVSTTKSRPGPLTAASSKSYKRPSIWERLNMTVRMVKKNPEICVGNVAFATPVTYPSGNVRWKRCLDRGTWVTCLSQKRGLGGGTGPLESSGYIDGNLNHGSTWDNEGVFWLNCREEGRGREKKGRRGKRKGGERRPGKGGEESIDSELKKPEMENKPGREQRVNKPNSRWDWILGPKRSPIMRTGLHIKINHKKL